MQNAANVSPSPLLMQKEREYPIRCKAHIFSSTLKAILPACLQGIKVFKLQMNASRGIEDNHLIHS
eukprot:1160130-Pelagomonas_calceolata.AAC.5